MADHDIQLGDLYKECEGKKPRIIGKSPNMFRSVCAKARTWAVSDSIPLDEAVDALVMKNSNGIATIDWESNRLRKLCRDAGVQPKDKFGGLVERILRTSTSKTTITKKVYQDWRNEFNATANARAATVAINRLIFSCFPTQFCSVMKESLLREVCGVLKKNSAIDLGGVDIEKLDWFDLCGQIIPKLRKAMPDKDYAEISAFLAAIGEIWEDDQKLAKSK